MSTSRQFFESLPALRIRQLPRLAIFHADKFVRFVVADDSLVLRIPGDFVPGAIRDVTQMRDGGNVMAEFEVEHGRLPGFHAVEEIADVRGPRIAAAFVLL